MIGWRSTEDRDVRAAAQGDRRAFTRLVERHRGAVCAVALGITGDIASSEDVAQDVFVTAWRELTKLREPSAFRSWLLESTRNRARDLVRSRAVRVLEPAATLDGALDPSPSADEELTRAEDARRITASMDALDEPDREVLTLYYRDGQRLAEVARQLALTEEAARQRLSRARKRLQADVERRLAEALARTAPGLAFTERLGRQIPLASRLPTWAVAGSAAAVLVGGATVVWWGAGESREGSPRDASIATADPAGTRVVGPGGRRETRSSNGGEVATIAPEAGPGTGAEAGTTSTPGAWNERGRDPLETPILLDPEVAVRARYHGPPGRTKRIKMTPECGSEPRVDEEVLVNGGALANVFVRVIEGAEVTTGSRLPPHEIVQEDCVYRPRVSGIVAGQSIAVTSRDGFLHNVHTFAGDISIFNKGQPAPSTFVKAFEEFTYLEDGRSRMRLDGPITFRCDVHPWMVAHVFVTRNPHFGVTDANGNLALRLPHGTYTLEAWHESLGTRKQRVDTRTGADVTFEFWDLPDRAARTP